MSTEIMPAPFALGSSESRSLELDHFGVVHAKFPPGSVLAMHSHAREGIAVMLHGSFDLDLPHRSFSCPPGTVVAEPAGERHANRIGKAGAEVLVLECGTTTADLFGGSSLRFDRVTHRRDFGMSIIASRMVPELLRPDALSVLQIESLAIQLLVGTLRDARALPDRRPAWLNRVRDFLEGTESTAFRMADLSTIAGVDAGYLSRTFRRHFGRTPGAYARILRLERCARQLVETDGLISAIATEAGFTDPSHFTRSFRRHFRTTPAAFRRSFSTRRR
jgi:AraC family transcriptional regulator